MHIKGLFTALITPFRNDDINWDLFDFLLQRQLEAQVDGIVLMGTTGETATLAFEERASLIRRAQQQTKNKTLLIAGIGTNSTKTTLEQAYQAQECGADALQLVMPSYNKPSQEGLLAHIRAVHDAVTIPLCLYNIPGRTGVNLTPKTVASLHNCTRIKAIKESSENLPQMMDIKESAPFLTLLAGDDLLFLPTTSIGGQGVTSVVSNLLPKTTKQLVDYALTGHMEEARQLFYAMKPLIQGCFFETNPAPIKMLLELVGIEAGAPRLPLVSVTDATKAKLQLLIMNSHEILKNETCSYLQPTTCSVPFSRSCSTR